MNIALATDHAGYEQLKSLQAWLESLGHTCHNFGPASLQPDDDYTDFVKAVAKAVASGEYQRGIIMGGSGQGEAMAANRLRGIRCAVFYGTAVARKVVDASGRVSHDPYEIIKLSRLHNDSNVLSLAARFLNMEDMKDATKLWLETPFSNEARHSRRNSKLDEA
ncbi:RpiB/LacA/LacB family sugar-phosphate isomerase [Candidatus Saccharibacteria bacterium]|nr:RpiB/LacA/LacB family sugar-phosphate isomerase [Candidatus Saccharibacteria bacterium]